MASTQQSAVEYIKNGAEGLKEGLKNLQLIENILRQRKLFSDSEIEGIFTKSSPRSNQVRNLLDTVIKKGEDVCYELLRILDDTRYQTFPMPVESHPELHQWISCFSFQHDPQIHTDNQTDSGPRAQYQKHLKTQAMHILLDRWRQNMTFLKNKSKGESFKYIPLVLDTDISALPHNKIKDGKKNKTKAKKLKTYIPTDKRRLSPSYLLRSHEKKILLVGKPGSGKSTVAHEILRMWIDEEDSHVSYMFYFDETLMKRMCESAEKDSLRRVFFNQSIMPVESADIVWKDMEDNSENVVIIFDGLMDIVSDSVIERIMKREVLNDAKIFIICRPEADDSGDLSDWASFRVEVQGFSEASIKAYFKSVLGTNDDASIIALKNVELFSLCHVPMYALILAAGMLLNPSEVVNQPCTVTDMYLRIFNYCHTQLCEAGDSSNKCKRDSKSCIMSLASASYQAILSNTVHLADVSVDDTIEHAYLTPVMFEGASTSKTTFVFQHNTMHEFWAALFLLITPEKITQFLHQSQTEEGMNLKYVIMFLCGLLSEKMEVYLKCLVTPDQVKSISAKYFEDIMNTFLYCNEEDDPDPDPDVEPESICYVCQCLYEYQNSEACLLFLQKVKNRLHLNDQPLDPHECCAISYVIRQSSLQIVQLDLMNCTISELGLKLILGSISNLKSLRLSSASVQLQIWRVALQESSTDFDSLLRLFGFEMHLSVQQQSDSNMLQNTKSVLGKNRNSKIKLCLHLDIQQRAGTCLLKTICGNLHNIAGIRIISPDYPRRSSVLWKSEVDSFQMDLFLQGALRERETGEKCVQHLLSVDSPVCSCTPSEQSNFIFTLYLRAKQLRVLEVLKPVFQAWPSYWVLDVSQTKTSLLLELLELQEVKKPVELWMSIEEHELRIFLKCLPYVSQLRFNDYIHIQVDDTKAAIKLLVDLFVYASESGDEDTLNKLSSVCTYTTFPFAVNLEENQTVFLLDLFSYIREYESQETGKSILPAMRPIFQSVPDVWILDLSKDSVMLAQISVIPQVLKLQDVKKPIELSCWKDEPDKLVVLLECLPYMSQLRIRNTAPDLTGAVHFFAQLFILASKQNDIETLSSVCSYSTFPFAGDTEETQSNFLLELYSYLREYESQTAKSVLPALLPIYKSAPSVWVIDLSERVTLLPQIMEFQALQKPVNLCSWSNGLEKSLHCLNHFLQCLPFVSHLRLKLLQCGGNKSDAEVILDLFSCALETGDVALQMLTSVCCYPTFPFSEDTGESQSTFLLDLHSNARNYEMKAERRILPALLPIYRSAPAVWVLDLSNGVTSLLHETMQLQAAKRPVELRGWTNDENVLKCFLKCLPFVSQLRFSDLGLILNDDIKGAVKLLVDLFIFASEIGKGILNLLTSVCSYSTFPFADNAGEIQSIFMLELHCFVRDCEFQIGKSVLSALLPIFQSAPPVWVIDLSKGMASFLHHTMQLQEKKRPVELRGWTADDSELRKILHCVPYMSELNCSDSFFQSVFEVMSTNRNWNPEDVISLLRPLNFNVTLMEVLPRHICSAVGKVLGLANPQNLCLSLIPQSISWQGTDALFSALRSVQKLRMNEYAILKFLKMARIRSQRSLTIEEISLVSTSQKSTIKLISSLSSIMRIWTVRTLDLTEICVDGRFLILLFALDEPVSLRLSDENLHQLAEIVYDTQDDFLTQSFLKKVGGDLSPCSLSWDVLQYLLQQSKIRLKLDPRKNGFGKLNIQHLLPLLHNIHFSGTDSRIVRNALKDIYTSRDGHMVTIVVRTSDNWINLSEQELESDDCAALRFALHYSDDVRLNLSGTKVPKEETESILQLLHRVSELRVDRHLLLNFLRTCLDSRVKKRVTISLLMALQHKLDFSCSSTISLFGQKSEETLRLSDTDCQAISSAIQQSDHETELIMFDCQASNYALLQLFPALHNIHLSLSKPQLLQLMSLTESVREGDSWSRARDLSRALRKKVDLSGTPIDVSTCEALGLVLQHFEDLNYLNLSHCELTDACLDLLLPHLHKVQLLDLNNNDITDAGAQRLLKILGSTQTVNIFNNQITDIRLFMNYQSSPVKYHNSPSHVNTEMKTSVGFMIKRIATVAMFDPEIFFNDDRIIYRFECELGGEFQCRATGLVFGMRGRGCVEYRVVDWNMCNFSINSYEPAGPLYNIQDFAGQMFLLHLPHCETNADGAGDISVSHIRDGAMELLTPVKITCSHVTVCINGLSSFGVVRRKGCMTRYVRGQVLLFLEHINTFEQRLWVFLLPRNVSATEIKKQHHEYTPIKTSSDCILKQKGKYCLSSSLKKYNVQPKTYSFHDASDSDHHSAFELFFSSEVSELRVRIHEKNNKLKTRWSRRVILKTNDNHGHVIKVEDGISVKGNSLLTEQNWKSSLCDLLEELSEGDLKKMKSLMKNVTKLPPIPKGKLEKKDRQELVDLMVEAWGFPTSVHATEGFMKKLPRNDNAVTSILKPYLIQFGLFKE